MDENVKHASFQLGNEAKAWTVEPAENGTFTITNNGKFIQYGNGTFTTFGAWTEAQENAVKPMLFVLDDAASSINGVQTTVKPQSNVRYNIAGQRVAADYKGNRYHQRQEVSAEVKQLKKTPMPLNRTA